MCWGVEGGRTDCQQGVRNVGVVEGQSFRDEVTFEKSLEG